MGGYSAPTIASMAAPASTHPAIYNGADALSAPPQDVSGLWPICSPLPHPPLVAYEDAELSPMARSFYADNKRVDSRKMQALTGGWPTQPTARA